jgi:hypothetical protein
MKNINFLIAGGDLVGVIMKNTVRNTRGVSQ